MIGTFVHVWWCAQRNHVESKPKKSSWGSASCRRFFICLSFSYFGRCVSSGRRAAEMSNSNLRDKSFLRLLTLLMVIYGVQRGESRLAEILFEEEDSPAAVSAANLNHAAIPTPSGEDNACHVEFTVLKRAVGRCIKVGKATRACISGTYFQPFHPDCM